MYYRNVSDVPTTQPVYHNGQYGYWKEVTGGAAGFVPLSVQPTSPFRSSVTDPNSSDYIAPRPYGQPVAPSYHNADGGGRAITMPGSNVRPWTVALANAEASRLNARYQNSPLPNINANRGARLPVGVDTTPAAYAANRLGEQNQYALQQAEMQRLYGPSGNPQLAQETRLNAEAAAQRAREEAQRQAWSVQNNSAYARNQYAQYGFEAPSFDMGAPGTYQDLLTYYARLLEEKRQREQDALGSKYGYNESGSPYMNPQGNYLGAPSASQNNPYRNQYLYFNA